MTEFDHDFAIVGSRFVGSVSALRLSEKGYSVVVLEMGKRWKREDFPKSTWDVRKYLWRPREHHLRDTLRRRWYWSLSRMLDSDRGDGPPVPVYIPVHIPVANLVANLVAEKMGGGVAQSGLLEVLLGKASTAHILGGCPIGLTPDDGVVDPQSPAFGYDDLSVIDGSIIPANPPAGAPIVDPRTLPDPP